MCDIIFIHSEKSQSLFPQNQFYFFLPTIILVIQMSFSNYTLFTLDNALITYQNIFSYSSTAKNFEYKLFSWENENSKISCHELLKNKISRIIDIVLTSEYMYTSQNLQGRQSFEASYQNTISIYTSYVFHTNIEICKLLLVACGLHNFNTDTRIKCNFFLILEVWVMRTISI